jgi:hypothetical protein
VDVFHKFIHELYLKKYLLEMEFTEREKIHKYFYRIRLIALCINVFTFFLTFDFHKDTKLTVKFRDGILINCEWNPLSPNVCESNWGYCVMLHFLYKMRFRSIFFSWQLHRNTIEIHKPNNIIIDIRTH